MCGRPAHPVRTQAQTKGGGSGGGGGGCGGGMRRDADAAARPPLRPLQLTWKVRQSRRYKPERFLYFAGDLILRVYITCYIHITTSVSPVRESHSGLVLLIVMPEKRERVRFSDFQISNPPPPRPPRGRARPRAATPPPRPGPRRPLSGSPCTHPCTAHPWRTCTARCGRAGRCRGSGPDTSLLFSLTGASLSV